MNTKKILLLAMSSLLSGQALALAQTGALGTAATATDYYEVKCAKNTNGDTSYLQFSIIDSTKNATAVINAQITKGRYALTTSDNNASDTVYSPALKATFYTLPSTTLGNGSYFVSVNKTAAGARIYSFNATCMTATAKAAAITITSRQNQ